MKTILVTYNNVEHSISIDYDLNSPDIFSNIIEMVKEELKIQKDFNLIYKYTGDIMNSTNIINFINKTGEFYIFELPSIVESRCISAYSKNSDISIPQFSESDIDSTKRKSSRNEIDHDSSNFSDKLDKLFDSTSNSLIADSTILDEEICFTDKCTLCGFKFRDRKYVCSICDNLSMCDNCESNHNKDHPTIKLKSKRSLCQSNQDIYYYHFLNLKNNQMKPDTKRQIQLKTDARNIVTVRKDTFIRIPFDIIKNESDKYHDDENLFTIKNYYPFTIIFNEESNSKVIFTEGKSTLRKTIILKSPKEVIKENEKYTITFFICNNSKKHFMSNYVDISFQINDDMEEEELNKKFEYFDMIKLLPKEKKKIIYDRLQKEDNKSPIEIYNELLE